MTLVGRDKARTERVAADLLVRSPRSRFRVRVEDFTDPVAMTRLAADVAAEGAVDRVLIAHGWLPQQGACQTDLTACRTALEINGVSPVLYAEAFAEHMARAGHGTLAMIGSVAGDRGRAVDSGRGRVARARGDHGDPRQHPGGPAAARGNRRLWFAYLLQFGSFGDRVVLMSPSPGRIAQIFDIPLARPRDINSAELAGYASQIAAALM